jgi:hypothetical protein
MCLMDSTISTMEIDAELLASIIASSPVPPLPQLVLRGEDSVDSTCSSHDTLASMLVRATQLNDTVANAERKDLQMKLLWQYQCAFMDLVTRTIETGVYGSVDKDVYNLFCSYTREHVATYLQNNKEQQLPDLRFMPYDIVSCYKHGSSLFDRTHQHLCALIDILNMEHEAAGEPKITKPIIDQTSYGDLLYMYAKFAWV